MSELPHLKLDAGTDATFGGSVPLSIGKFNRGELTIAGGSMVSNSLGSIAGNTTSAEGTVTVTGTDGMGNASTWNSIGILSVGGSGTGTLRIENGGNVISHRGQLGASASGTGTVFVTGAGSSWTNLFGNLYVGGSVITGEGGVGSLTVEDQGLVYVNEVLRIFGDSEVTINGGTIAFETLQIEPGGSLAFNFGTINYLSDLSISSGDQLESLLGGSHTIPIAKKIQVDGTTTLFNVLTIDGGAFSTANLLNPQLLQFERGTLELTGASGLTIGDGELFGNSLSIGSEQNLQIANTLTIDLGATLSLRTDGSISAGTLANSGILQGSGVITATLVNQVGGLVRVQATDLLTISDTAHTNDGDIQIQGGRLDFTGSLTNNTNGNILGRGTLATTGGLVNQGDLALSNGQTDIFGDVDNQTAGRVIVSGNADVTFWDDVTHTGALFNVSTGSSATFFGTAGFGISGGGDVFFEADVTPGSSPGLETFGGNVHFGAVSNLEIEIEGSTPGSEFDRLEISGAASLGGSLEVLADPDVDVSVGDLLLFIYAQGGIFNAFESVSLPTLDGGKEFRLLYGETIVGLEVILSGDYNNDGFVNPADYVVWRDSMSNNSSGYDAWRANFGATIGIGASQVVPEPATFLLAILAVVGLLFGRACPSRR